MSPYPESKLEATMRLQLEEAKLTDGMEQEYIFHPEVNWRFDFCWPERLVALEVQGGVFTGGRHARPSGMIEDMRKFSEAAILGWRLILVSALEIRNGDALDRVKRALSDGGPPCTRCEDWELDG